MTSTSPPEAYMNQSARDDNILTEPGIRVTAVGKHLDDFGKSKDRPPYLEGLVSLLT